MDVATMAAINSINTMNLMVAMQLEANGYIIRAVYGKRMCGKSV